jgi:hypothetical protein
MEIDALLDLSQSAGWRTRKNHRFRAVTAARLPAEFNPQLLIITSTGAARREEFGLTHRDLADV